MSVRRKHRVGSDFLNMTPKVRATKEKKQVSWTSSKFKTFVHQGTLPTESKSNLKNWRKYLKIIHLTRD